MREILTTSRSYFARPDGDDSADGLTPVSAVATPQALLDRAAGLDFNRQTVTINLSRPLSGASAIFTQPPGNDGHVLHVKDAWIGGGRIVIFGDVANNDNIVLRATGASGSAVRTSSAMAGGVTVQGVRVESAGEDGIHHEAWGELEVGNVTFGNCAGSMLIVGHSLSHLEVLAAGSTCYIDGSAYHAFYGDMGFLYAAGNVAFRRNCTFARLVLCNFAGRACFDHVVWNANGNSITYMARKAEIEAGGVLMSRASGGFSGVLPGVGQIMKKTGGSYAGPEPVVDG